MSVGAIRAAAAAFSNSFCVVGRQGGDTKALAGDFQLPPVVVFSKCTSLGNPATPIDFYVIVY